jgi:hypothetical protein
VNFARQYYRRDVIDRVLNSIIITRPFTVYQLADIVINQLPRVIQQYEAKMVVISDLLSMFLHDPQIEIREARYLINEILNSITKTRASKEYVLAVVSLSSGDNASHHDKSALSINKTILTRFDRCIEIMNSRNNENKMIDIKIRNNSKSNIRRIKDTTKDFHNHELFFSIKERDLLTLEPWSR